MKNDKDILEEIDFLSKKLEEINGWLRVAADWLGEDAKTLCRVFTKDLEELIYKLINARKV